MLRPAWQTCTILVCLTALGAESASAGAWTPWAKDKSNSPEAVSSTARPTFDGERPAPGGGNGVMSTHAPAKPGVMSRVSQGTSRALSKTKDALSLRKDDSAGVTVSKFPKHAPGYRSTPVSASTQKGGFLKRWIRPSDAGSRPSGPPATTGEFLSLDRPKF